MQMKRRRKCINMAATTLTILFLLGTNGSDGRTEKSAAKPFDLWSLITGGDQDILAQLTSEAYDFSPVTWPQEILNVNGRLTITSSTSSPPTLLKFSIMSKLVTVHPGSRLKLENMVIQYERTRIMPFNIIPFFKLLPGTVALLSGCTILLGKCAEDHAAYIADHLEAIKVNSTHPIEKRGTSLNIKAGAFLNAPGEGQWAVEDLTYACPEDFDFEILNAAPIQDKEVAPLSGSQVVLGLLDPAIRTLKIVNGINLMDSGWPLSGLMLRRNVTIAGPEWARGRDRPVIHVGDIAPLWEVKRAVLELKNVILDISAPFPRSRMKDPYLVDDRAHYLLHDSEIDLAGFILPIAFITNYGGVYKLSNVRFRYHQCIPGVLRTAVAGLVASGSCEECMVDVQGDTGEILFAYRATVLKCKDNSTSLIGRMEMINVEFECMKYVEYVPKKEVDISVGGRNYTQADESSSYRQVVWHLGTVFLCLLLFVYC